MIAPEYVAARRVLLDALDAIGAHRRSVVLVGAQAGYLHAGDTGLSVAVMTTDWFKFRRFHGEIGLVPPVEYETTYRSTTLPEQPAQREFEASIKTNRRPPGKIGE